jgi:Icc-related predicted phosphoesterase
MPLCFFVSDLHGHIDRYLKLSEAIQDEQPAAVFFGGDLLPSRVFITHQGVRIKEFISDFLLQEFRSLKHQMGDAYPQIFLILGNDDGKGAESQVEEGEKAGLWHYVHNRKASFGRFSVFGYAYVPPTPFLLKDWERYDVSRYVDPGCIPPEEGWRTDPSAAVEDESTWATIKQDLDRLVANENLSRAIFLFHSPPHRTNLDRADLDGRIIDNVQVDVHVGSIAIKRFIEVQQPFLTLHGHVHESTRMTGSWQQKIGRTHSFSAAHDGPELALVRFDLDELKNATRVLI